MLYMLTERYLHGAGAVYARFAERGRMLPDGVEFVDSWVVDSDPIGLCFQLMRTDDRALLDEWCGRWDDLVEFEVFALTDSETAARRSGAA